MLAGYAVTTTVTTVTTSRNFKVFDVTQKNILLCGLLQSVQNTIFQPRSFPIV